MKIFDTLSRKYKTIKNPQANIYSCGPTIYDYIHIGNARPILLTDTLIKFLEFKKVKVNFLQNITDIDDKIISKSLETNTPEIELTNFFKKAYLKNLKELKVRMPNQIVCISDEIKLMQSFIDNLIINQSAYETKSGIYFNINKFKSEYGKLSNIKVDDLISKTAEDFFEDKNLKADFSLWKTTNVGLNWDFHKQKGRPGWHTECVTLIDNYFNHETIDIHIGGIDLQFPHHENERIQFLAKNNKELSYIWMHNGHLTVDNVKMSKSLNNTTHLKDFIQTYGVNVLRWLFQTTHYKQPINITDDLLKQGVKFEDKINNCIKKLKQWLIINEAKVEEQVDEHILNKFDKYMNDDLNTPQVLMLINFLISNINKEDNFKIKILQFNTLKIILQVLGFSFEFNLNVDDQIKMLYLKQKEHILNKEFVEADQIRAILIKEGLL
ncbi:cysteinyl-tRNA synthetase [Entomoplasma ellychniae]|uniref:Cysteine--tRNA ligase n=1 Tax=Entomoplasma ellychniae TaxID=2114 RepID=A0A8E2QYZ9_9MOLU|nr:cysteine--tRNA ligase [Entomoplasma ellychniae]PPE04869.1 cysteinyl-tRNA synthetase [Entomoplasma ellychniae]